MFLGIGIRVGAAVNPIPAGGTFLPGRFVGVNATNTTATYILRGYQ